jgi:hypothetical protein
MATHHIDEYTEVKVRPESLWNHALMVTCLVTCLMIARGMGQTIVRLIASLQFVRLLFNKGASKALSEFGASPAIWLT